MIEIECNVTGRSDLVGVAKCFFAYPLQLFAKFILCKEKLTTSSHFPRWYGRDRRIRADRPEEFVKWKILPLRKENIVRCYHRQLVITANATECLPFISLVWG